MRISIRKHHQSYLHRLGWQMECDNPSEIINYLLTELKRINYSFNAEVSLGIAGNTYSHQSESTEPGQCAMSGISAVMDDSDPIIERFVALGLDEF